jgi:dTDP-4-dehydrorhamnose 3,5-epimerase
LRVGPERHDTEVAYKVTSYYDPAAERGVAWDDSALRIAWPWTGTASFFRSATDISQRLADLADYFPYASFPC